MKELDEENLNEVEEIKENENTETTDFSDDEMELAELSEGEENEVGGGSGFVRATRKYVSMKTRKYVYCSVFNSSAQFVNFQVVWGNEYDPILTFDINMKSVKVSINKPRKGKSVCINLIEKDTNGKYKGIDYVFEF